MEVKLDAGGISYDNIQLLKDNKFAMESTLTRWIHRFGSSRAGERYNQVKSIVMNECQIAYDNNIPKKPLLMRRPSFGTQMLNSLRIELKQRHSNNPDVFLGCLPEHLYGMSGILTEECKVWWSDKFDLK
ncbi:hypothetical protein [Lewinella sp. LCG006]|uniref:hypothetical protein n=1 Tax=Lewinella sp. LCG006 TaxID=3231911 RepID=UPI003460627A